MVTKSKKRVAAKKEKALIYPTPVGLLSSMFLLEPQTEGYGGNPASNKYQCDILVKKELLTKGDGEKLVEAILKKAETIWPEGLESPFEMEHGGGLKDMDSLDSVSDKLKGHIRIRAKTNFKPVVYGPDKQPMYEDEISALVDGYWGRLFVSPYAYTKGTGGVSLNLAAVQYWKKGEPLASGQKQVLSVMGEMEVPLDDLEGEKENDDVDFND